MLPFTVNNIKASCKIISATVSRDLRELASKSSLVTKTRGNFFVLRKDFVFIIFYTGHVNCTKLKLVTDIEKARTYLESLIDKSVVTTPKIDNITTSGASHPSSGGVNLFKLCQYLKDRGISYRFKPHRFPGLNFKIGGATIIIFTSGKFIAVGTQSIASAFEHIELFSILLGEYELLQQQQQQQ